MNRGGANYSDNVIKHLQGLVWKASEMKRLNQPVLIETNLSRYEANEWYFEAVGEVLKLKKEFGIESSGKFVYTECRKWDKAVENFLFANINLRGIPLAYVIRKDDYPVTIMFDDIVYGVDPEYLCINAAPLTGIVIKRDNL